MKRLDLLALGVLLLPSLTAQGPNPVLVGGLRSEDRAPGALFLLEHKSANVFTPLARTSSLEQNPASLAVDEIDPSAVYVGTYGRRVDGSSGPCLIYALQVSQGQITSARVLNSTPLAEDYISAVVPLGPDIVYLGRFFVGTVPRAGGPVARLFEIENWMDPRGMTSEGRYIYLAVDDTEIRKYDLFNPGTWKVLTKINQFQGEEIQNLAMDNAGNLLVVTSDLTRGGRLLAVHHDSGKTVRELRLPLASGRAVAQDPESDTIYVVGGLPNLSSAAAVIIEDWKIAKGPIGQMPNALPCIVVLKPRNVYRIGTACQEPDGSFARIGTSGRASTQTSGFALTLRTKTNRQSILVLGVEPAGHSLIDLGFVGAPGCELGVAALQLVYRTSDANGFADVKFATPPCPTMYCGVMINAQWLVNAPTVNQLGIITSQTARISVRD